MLEDIKEFFRWLFDVPYPVNFKLHPYHIKDGQFVCSDDPEPEPYQDYGSSGQSTQGTHSLYGSRYYSNPGGFGMPSQCIDDHGRIYNSPAPIGMPTGSIDDHGRIYDNPAAIGMPTGCIDDHGRIYDSPAPIGMPVGCIDDHGRIYDSPAPIGMPIGVIKP